MNSYRDPRDFFPSRKKLIKQTNKIVLALNRGESMNKMFEMLRVEQERSKARAYKTGDTRQFIGKNTWKR